MAFTSSLQWDVRTTGNSANGGGFDPTTAGTNYATQDSPQVAFTDLVIDASTNTKMTSSANPFTSAHVGNVINITGGSGFTAQRVQIISVSGSAATCDKAVGTVSSTGGTGNLGGGLTLITDAQSLAVAQNQINIKSGTYTLTAGLTVPVSHMTYRGYGTSWNDGGTKPLITTSTNSVNIFTNVASSQVDVTLWNLSLSSTAGTPGNGISASGTNWAGLTCVDCKINGFARGIYGDNGGAEFFMFWVQLINTEITGCTTAGVQCQGVTFYGCYVHDNPGDGWTSSGTTAGSSSQTSIIRSIFASNGGHGAKLTTTTNTTLSCHESIFYGNTSDGIDIFGSFGRYTLGISNCIFYGNGGFGVNVESGSASFAPAICHNNAFGSNTSGNMSNSVPLGMGAVSLTGNPFNNVSTKDFSLNTTAGAGAACAAAGFPGAVGGTGSTGSQDIGAIQSAGGGGGGGTVTYVISPHITRFVNIDQD